MADFDAQPGRAPQPDLSVAQRDADEIDLRAGLTGVASLVAGLRPTAELLGDVADFAVHAVPGADGVSVAVLPVRPTGMDVELCATTADFVTEIDRIQYQELREGPSLTCLQSARVVVSGSLGSDVRWTHFGGRVARMSVHSALSLPLVADDAVHGVLSCLLYTSPSPRD